MNLLQLKQRMARRTNKNASSLDSTVSARFTDFLNEAHREELRKPGRESLRWATTTFASVSGTQQYALPTEGVARINRIWETTNDRKLVYRTMDWLREVDPDPSQGTPWAWIPAGYVEVHTQPSDASSVFVKSSAAGDTTQTAYVEGIVTGGYYRTASVTLTGTTAVNLSSAISTFERITKFYVSATCTGAVTLHEDSGAGTELSKITIGKTRAQFYSLLLHDIPSSAITYTCDILRGIPEMSNNTDEPLLPEDFHDVLLYRALMKEYTKGDDPKRWQQFKGEYDQATRDLDTFLTAHPDWRPQWGGESIERSALGAWFPAGS